MGKKTFQSKRLGELPRDQDGYDSRAEQSVVNATLRKGMLTGFIGGLVATLVIDLVVVGMFPFVGMPAKVSFSIIGDTAAGFFSMLGIEMAGGVPLGLLVHYLTGLSLGGIFGRVASRHDILRLDSTKKGVGLGILYTEVASFPLLVTAPIILKMAAPDAAQWFGVSFVMHAVFGLVLGMVVSYGLRSATAARQA